VAHPGVDVARFGTDRTVITLAAGPRSGCSVVARQAATTETTGRVIAGPGKPIADEIRVDGVGVGGGVVDQLAEQGHRVSTCRPGGCRGPSTS
jgi:hypothetical protein